MNYFHKSDLYCDNQTEFNMKKSFSFYPADWTRDLDDYELEIEGSWIRLCCRMFWTQERGILTKSLKEFSAILRKSESDTLYLLQYLINKKIASGDVSNNQKITIISRRMVRDNEVSIVRKKIGKYGGNPNLVTKKLYGDYVLLTEIEYNRLCEMWGKPKTDDWIERMNIYAGSKQKKFKEYNSHCATLINWERKRAEDNGEIKIISSEKQEPPQKELRLPKINLKWQTRFQEKVIDPLKDEMSEQSWTAFIKPLIVIGVEKNCVTLYISPDRVSWVKDNYSEKIVDKLGKPIKITSDISRI